MGNACGFGDTSQRVGFEWMVSGSLRLSIHQRGEPRGADGRNQNYQIDASWPHMYNIHVMDGVTREKRCNSFLSWLFFFFSLTVPSSLSFFPSFCDFVFRAHRRPKRNLRLQRKPLRKDRLKQDQTPRSKPPRGVEGEFRRRGTRTGRVEVREFTV